MGLFYMYVFLFISFLLLCADVSISVLKRYSICCNQQKAFFFAPFSIHFASFVHVANIFNSVWLFVACVENKNEPGTVDSQNNKYDFDREEKSFKYVLCYLALTIYDESVDLMLFDHWKSWHTTNWH